MRSTRRAFVRQLGLLGAGLAALPLAGCRLAARGLRSLPQLRPDPAGIFDLPPGFTYTVLSRTGETMDDGHAVPPGHDGMAAFAGPGGSVVLVRNHELALSHAAQTGWDPARFDPAALYDPVAPGGTTTLVYDPRERRLLRHFRSLAGTARNCAGGPTPWGSWITCEESVDTEADGAARRHGYCFEVPARAEPALSPAWPLVALGRFNHEAVAVDPRSGCVYLTEDRPDGLLYRLVPSSPGELARGGRLQALCVRGTPRADTRNWSEGTPRIGRGAPQVVQWADLQDVDPAQDDLRLRGTAEAGAALFARAEGICLRGSELFVSCTSGGPDGRGQLWRYRLSPAEATANEDRQPGMLELIWEGSERETLRNPDNLTSSHPPRAVELYICEDGSLGPDRLVRADALGHTQVFGRNALSDSELAGATFSPDGQVLFVNIQTPGLTLAIHGPF
jgi:secreted PhoX family phosphatase